MNDRRPSRWLVAAAALIVVGFAAFFRLHQIDTVPHGLFIDEAQNGLDALCIYDGTRFPVFVEAGSVKGRGREPMLHYLMAGVFRLRGPTVESIRLTVALAGTITVFLFFLLSNRLFGLHVAFVAAVLLAASRWHVTMSRVGVRAVLTPLAILVVLLALRHLARCRKATAALLFGAAVGAGFYTYPAFWIVPGVLLVGLLSLALFRPGSWRRSDARLAFLSLISFLAVTAPLLRYAVAKPDYFFARTSNLSTDLRNSDDRPAMLLDHLQRGFFMLHFRGDESPMYNIPGRPLLDPVTGIAFVAGLFVILKELPRQPILHGALLCFWIFPLIPGAMTAAGAWGMRSIGSVPAVFLIAGVGLVRLTRSPIPWVTTPRWVAALLLTVALAIVGAFNYRGYFDEWANDPRVEGSYTTDVVRFFDFCAGLARVNDVYLSPYVYASPNFRFLNVERAADLRLLDDVSDLTTDAPGDRCRVFVSDYPPVTGLISDIYPNQEEIGRYSVWGRNEGFVLRVPGDELKPFLPVGQRREAAYWIDRMRTQFETNARNW